MATTTPNYGWAVPTSTDLVKDGATAIETLGDAIDASMNTALGTKKAGMVLLNTTSFSGVSSISLAANTFSSTYQFYYLQGIFVADSTVSVRLRAAGSDNSTASSYEREWSLADASSITASYLADSSADIGFGRSGEKISLEMFVYDVNLAAKTYLSFKTIRPKTNMQIYNGGIVHNQTVAYDSMTFLSGSGNFGTGSRISVFGVNQ
jgi:hypothetical protein